jgi:Tol biopolymer transport system component
MKKAFLALVAITALAAAWMPASSSAATPGKIAFVSDRDGDDEVFVMNADGSGQTQLTFNTATEHDPFWSPNGKQIGFFSDRVAANVDELWVMNADGTSQRQLTVGTDGGYSGDWGPDGRTIVFGKDIPGIDQFFLINADGSGLRQLSSFADAGTGSYGAHFAPTGTQIVFTHDVPTGPDALSLLSSSGGLPADFTSINGYAPDFTGDGKRIVFYGNQAPDGGTDNEILSIMPTGAGLMQLTSTANGVQESAPSPSKDGLNRIAFRASDGDNEIFVMNGDGSGRVQITFNSGADSNDKAPDWQPTARCGKGVATIVGTAASETLVGGPKRDIISGQGGRDKIKGKGGNDILCGDKGKDKLIAGKGKKDTCIGGKGNDTGKACEREKKIP